MVLKHPVNRNSLKEISGHGSGHISLLTCCGMDEPHVLIFPWEMMLCLFSCMPWGGRAAYK